MIGTINLAQVRIVRKLFMQASLRLMQGISLIMIW
jgi:hypothetical protein